MKQMPKKLKRASADIDYSVKSSPSSQPKTMEIATSQCQMDQDEDAYTLLGSLKGYYLHPEAGPRKLTLYRFFNSSKFTDLTIQTTDGEFKVHKLVVCGQSEWFSRMCDREWKVRLHCFTITLISLTLLLDH